MNAVPALVVGIVFSAPIENGSKTCIFQNFCITLQPKY